MTIGRIINEEIQKLVTESEGGYELTLYRGVRSQYEITNFGVDKEYICTWLADNPYYAAIYCEECGGHLYEVKVDMSRLNEYDWYYESGDWFDPIDGFSAEEEKELLEQGYNGYSFLLNDGEMYCLFDPSLIIDAKEIPYEEYI